MLREPVYCDWPALMSRTYLAHHELESDFIIILIIVIIVVVKKYHSNVTGQQ